MKNYFIVMINHQNYFFETEHKRKSKKTALQIASYALDHGLVTDQQSQVIKSGRVSLEDFANYLYPFIELATGDIDQYGFSYQFRYGSGCTDSDHVITKEAMKEVVHS